jgi:SAM-dependent methyltransferase
VIGGTGPRRQFDLGSLESMGRPRSSDSSDSSERAGDVFLEGLPVARLNLGSGARGEPGWINADLKRGPGVQLVGDVRDGLPFSSECLDQIVSIHMLSMVPLPDVRPLLRELRRVLKPGGVLRLGLPDLGKGVAAWQSGDAAYFTVPDADARSLSAKLITQLLWYGHSVSLFTPEFAEELLRDAGFERVHHCRHGESATADAGMTELDNRAGESFFVEAVR